MFPDLTPLDPAQREMLQKGLGSLRPEQLVWLSGYLSGRASGFLPANDQGVLPTGGFDSASLPVSPAGTLAGAPIPQTALPPQSLPVLVLYGSESGNAEGLADQFFKKAKKAGFKPTLKNMADLTPADLQKQENIVTFVSTWGDGDPPETAMPFCDLFFAEEIDLQGKYFSVLALGDTSYEKFCQTGKDIDARFEVLGATRLVPRQDCDVDYEDLAQEWSDKVFAALKDLQPAAAPGLTQTTQIGDAAYSVEVAGALYDKKNPFPSEVLANLNLNGTGSSKETVHLELSLEGSGLHYEVGDALAVVPENTTDVVEQFLAASQIDPQTTVELAKVGSLSFEEALRFHLDITSLSRKIVSGYAALTSSSLLKELLDESRKEELKQFLYGRQIVDLFEVEAYQGSAQDLVTLLRKLPPRLYSIASSLKAHPDEVHLTVAAVRYEAYGKTRKGVASTYLADEAKVGEKVKVYVHKNKNFRLPSDPATPIIMVGPGTGVAPFRAFVEERAELAASGESWLFFGDQHYSYDFLYQLEWQDHLKNGDLTKLDVAFSRDQPQKVYVQHRMLEKGAELWEWLEQKGASFYVCGDAERMAGDVHQALLTIAQQHGGKSPAEAEQFLATLKKEKRYQRDVY